MHRFISNYGAEMANGNNDSVFSCQYDWNELSVGNDTLQSDNFFGMFWFPSNICCIPKKMLSIARKLDEILTKKN